MNDFEETLAQARNRALSDGTAPAVCHLPSERDNDALICGARPYKETYRERIGELAYAIGRCITNVGMSRENVQVMLTWARELEKQLDSLDSMLIYDT